MTTTSEQLRGFTFIEVLAVLSMIGLATVGVTLVRDWAMGNARISEAKAQVATLQAGAQLWRPRDGNYSGISMSALTAIAALPVAWTDGERLNPWGGDIQISVDGANQTRYVIEFSGITKPEEGARLARDLAELATVATFNGDSFSVTFQG